MNIGTFMLVKSEAPWIAAHILRVLPFLDEMVFFDGNSVDGTLEIIEAIKKDDKNGGKIKIFKDKDPKDLKDDYVRLFNEALRSLSTDLAFFLHPDMWIVNPDQLLLIKDSPAVALSTKIRSFAGEPGGQLYELAGRNRTWKNIHRLHNPDFGAHYFGHYGVWNEDVYQRDLTGDEHLLHNDLSDYPYEVIPSGLDILHFSDVRSYERRFSRMKTCLENQGKGKDKISLFAERHPRVTLKNGESFNGERFDFLPAEYPTEFLAAQAKYKYLFKSKEAVLV